MYNLYRLLDLHIFFILVFFPFTEHRTVSRHFFHLLIISIYFIIHTNIIGRYSNSGLRPSFLKPVMLCALILYMSSGTYSLKSTPNDRFLKSFIMAGLFTLRVFARYLQRGSRRRNIFTFPIWWLTWSLNSGLTSNTLSKMVRWLNFLWCLLLMLCYVESDDREGIEVFSLYENINIFSPPPRFNFT